MKSKHTSIRMDEKLFKLVAKRAKREHTTHSDIIIDALQSYFDNDEELTILEKNYLVTTLTFQYITLGEERYLELKDEIIEQTKDSIRSSKSIR